MCEYCDESNSPYTLLCLSDIDVVINKRKIHWFLELSDRHYNDIMIISYCPMCGRNLGGLNNERRRSKKNNR